MDIHKGRGDFYLDLLFYRLMDSLFLVWSSKQYLLSLKENGKKSDYWRSSDNKTRNSLYLCAGMSCLWLRTVLVHSWWKKDVSIGWFWSPHFILPTTTSGWVDEWGVGSRWSWYSRSCSTYHLHTLLDKPAKLWMRYLCIIRLMFLFLDMAFVLVCEHAVGPSLAFGVHW